MGYENINKFVDGLGDFEAFETENENEMPNEIIVSDGVAVPENYELVEELSGNSKRFIRRNKQGRLMGRPLYHKRNPQGKENNVNLNVFLEESARWIVLVDKMSVFDNVISYYGKSIDNTIEDIVVDSGNYQNLVFDDQSHYATTEGVGFDYPSMIAHTHNMHLTNIRFTCNSLVCQKSEVPL